MMLPFAKRVAATRSACVVLTVFVALAMGCRFRSNDSERRSSVPSAPASSTEEPGRQSSAAGSTSALKGARQSARVVDAGSSRASTELSQQDARVLDASALADVPKSATEWVKRWFDALRNRDIAALGAMTAYPFRFDDTGAVVGCRAGSADTQAELDAAVACLFADDLLDGALRANRELLYHSKTAASSPRWAKRWRKDWKPSDSIIYTELGDNGITYFFVVVVGSDGVRMLLRHAEFWPN